MDEIVGGSLIFVFHKNIWSGCLTILQALQQCHKDRRQSGASILQQTVGSVMLLQPPASAGVGSVERAGTARVDRQTYVSSMRLQTVQITVD